MCNETVYKNASKAKQLAFSARKQKENRSHSMASKAQSLASHRVTAAKETEDLIKDSADKVDKG